MKKDLILLCVILGLSGCRWGSDGGGSFTGDGNIQQEERSIGLFHAIEVDNIGTVIFTQGQHYTVRIEAEASIVPHVITKVHNDTLHICMEGTVTKALPIFYYVTAPQLKEIELSGTAAFQAEQLRADKLEIDMTGASHVSAHLDVASLDVEASGSSHFYLEGSALHQKFNLAGAAQGQAAQLAGDKVSVETSGAASLTVNVAQQLHAVVSGASYVGYKGEPRLTIRQSGTASINSIQ